MVVLHICCQSHAGPSHIPCQVTEVGPPHHANHIAGATAVALALPITRAAMRMRLRENAWQLAREDLRGLTSSHTDMRYITARAGRTIHVVGFMLEDSIRRIHVG